MRIHSVIAFLGIGLCCSCASEKFNGSPLRLSAMEREVNHPGSGGVTYYNIDFEDNVYASEITNLIATFPQFSSTSLNKEVSTLKTALQNYLYAVQANDIKGKKKELKTFEKSYQHIQKIRTSLTADENETINRYLVLLKTNIGNIENTLVEGSSY